MLTQLCTGDPSIQQQAYPRGIDDATRTISECSFVVVKFEAACHAHLPHAMYQHRSRRYNRQGRKANVGAGTATATEPTREHKQYATQGPTTYLCT